MPFFQRPGVQSSEFKVGMALLVWLGVDASQKWVSLLNALIIAAPGLFYIVSRGLAKTEPRGGGGA